MDHYQGPASRLATWFAQHGIELHPHVKVARDAATHLGLYATSPLTGETAVISVPSRICISSVGARSAIASLLPDAGPLDLAPEKWAILYVFLVRLLCISLSNQPGSSGRQEGGIGALFDHVGYVEAIPRLILIPLHFRPRELELLQATPLYGAALEKLRQTEEEYRAIYAWLQAQRGAAAASPSSIVHVLLETLERLDGDLTLSSSSSTGAFRPSLELYRWSNSVSLSRAFPPTLLPSLSADAGPVLIPGLDLPNHARSTAVTWSSHPSPSPSAQSEGEVRIVLTARYDIAQGAEVLNNYGPKSNEELLGSYAFVLPEGEDDFLTLKLGQVHPDKAESETGTYRWLRCAEGPPEGLLDEIQRRIDLDSPPSADEEAQSEELRKLQEQAEVLETLEVLLVQKRKSFKAVDAIVKAAVPSHSREEEGEVDELARNSEAPIRQSVYDMVRVYRQGQLTILNQAIKWTRSQLETIADQLDALESSSSSSSSSSDQANA
ncbi:hypothetical protein ACQY0O_006429 [Thecaphora frezii]